MVVVCFWFSGYADRAALERDRLWGGRETKSQGKIKGGFLQKGESIKNGGDEGTGELVVIQPFYFSSKVGLVKGGGL